MCWFESTSTAQSSCVSSAVRRLRFRGQCVILPIDQLQMWVRIYLFRLINGSNKEKHILFSLQSNWRRKIIWMQIVSSELVPSDEQKKIATFWTMTIMKKPCANASAMVAIQLESQPISVSFRQWYSFGYHTFRFKFLLSLAVVNSFDFFSYMKKLYLFALCWSDEKIKNKNEIMEVINIK